MQKIRYFIGRIKLQLRRGTHFVGWAMTPDEVRLFFDKQDKTVLTLFGYSGTGYENEAEMLQKVREILSGYDPKTTILNIGSTNSGIGASYPIAKSLGFTTTGITSSEAIVYPEEISKDVDYVFFVADRYWGGNLPGTDTLSPTSEAMVDCSDILVGIGGNDVTRDELVAGKKQGKPVNFYPAEVRHALAIRYAERKGLPPPESFWGTAHEVFGEQMEET